MTRWQGRGLQAGLLAGLLVGLNAQASAWFDEVDAYVRTLNSPVAKHALGVTDIRRPLRIANRLEVTFDQDTSPTERARILTQLASDFVAVLFRREGIRIASVVERSAAGVIVHRVNARVPGPAESC